MMRNLICVVLVALAGSGCARKDDGGMGRPKSVEKRVSERSDSLEVADAKRTAALPVKDGDDADWWQFPCYKTDRMESTPPNPPYAGKKYPYASVTIRVEDPARGGMSVRKYNALQRFLAQAIVPCGSKIIQTVEAAAHESLLHFWKQYLLKQRGKPIDDGYGIYELETAISYRGPEYVSYSVRSQTGCPCCSQTTNVVWNWQSESPLRIEDVIEMGMTNELKRIMRDAVRKEFADEPPGVILPEYAKDWPETFDHFSLDAKGLSWWCDAGEVLLGGKGALATTLTWRQLRPFLRNSFVIPTR